MLNVGMLGMGRMGNAHAPNLKSNPQVRLVAAFDPDTEHALAARDAYGMDLSVSAAELVARKDVDAVFITSPTYCHTEGVRLALKAGKPVFVEKPVCRTAAECAELEALGTLAGVPVAVGFVRRYWPAQRKFHDIVASGELGTLRHANIDLTSGGFKRMPGDWFADFALSGGVTLDMLSHHLDLLIWSLGMPETVYCQGNLMARKDLPLPQDYASITVRFPKDVLCNITCAWNRFGRGANTMDVYGDDGCATFDWMSRDVKVQKLGQEPETVSAPCDEDPYKMEDDSWVDAVVNGKTPEVTLADGIRAFKFANAALESAATGTVVALS